MRNLGKRQRLDDDADAGRAVAEEAAADAIAEAKDVLKDLQALYGSMPKEFLWDTSLFQRSRAKDLFEEMLALEAGRVLLIQGAEGSGKSTAVCSLAGYMLGNLKQKLVYICASRFIASPVEVLRHALLVATECDETLCGYTQLEQLVTWCRLRRKDRLLFVVDDWDILESVPDMQAAPGRVVSYHHILVKLSSCNSRERRIYLASDKQSPAFNFDGPYTSDELTTWIPQSGLSTAKLQALDCLTGGMPRLLRFYEEAKGKWRLFREKVDDCYTRKLFAKFIGLQTTKEQLASAVQMVTTGVRGIHLKEPVDLTCFYQEGDRFKLLSPYLRAMAEFYIMEQNAALQSALNYSHVQSWASAVRLDCVIKCRNSARAGWYVEGLLIGVMRYQGKLWKDGSTFGHYKTYKHGCETALLQVLTVDELCEGVLVGPLAFNEDIIFLKLELETRAGM